MGPNPRDPPCAPKHLQRGWDSGRVKLVLSQARRRNPCQRVRLPPEAFCSRDISWPCNQDRASRGKTRTRLAKGGHRDKPFYIEISGSQSKNLMKARPGCVQRNSQHQPKSPQSPQLPIATTLFPHAPFSVKLLDNARVEPFCKQLQIRLHHGHPPRD